MVLERNFEWFFVEPKMVLLWQWFSNLSCKHRCPAYFVSLSYQTHLIQLISSLVETARPELGVSDKGDIQNVQGRGACSTDLKTSQVTYVTMVPRVGNETLRPLGVATGNALSVTRSEDTYVKTPPVGRRQPYRRATI